MPLFVGEHMAPITVKYVEQEEEGEEKENPAPCMCHV